jgi:hypothetical protein
MWGLAGAGIAAGPNAPPPTQNGTLTRERFAGWNEYANFPIRHFPGQLVAEGCLNAPRKWPVQFPAAFRQLHCADSTRPLHVTENTNAFNAGAVAVLIRNVAAPSMSTPLGQYRLQR